MGSSIDHVDGIKDIFDHPFPIWGPTNENDTLHSPLEKHYNDSLDSQSSNRSWEKVTYFYVGDFFVYNMALSKSMPIFKKTRLKIGFSFPNRMHMK